MVSLYQATKENSDIRVFLIPQSVIVLFCRKMLIPDTNINLKNVYVHTSMYMYNYKAKIDVDKNKLRIYNVGDLLEFILVHTHRNNNA